MKALDLAGADLPLEGQLVVAAPGQVAAATQAACIGDGDAARHVGDGALGGGPDAERADVSSSRTSGAQTALGPAFIAICLPPPDVPVGTPGRATFGAKVYSAELTINGVFSAVAVGAWVSFWTPYNPGAGTVEQRGHRRGAGRDRTGRREPRREAHQGTGRDGHRARDAGGPGSRRRDRHDLRWARRRQGSRRLGRASVAANGAFTFKAKTGTFFRADAVAAPGAAAPLCAAARDLLWRRFRASTRR